MERWVHNPLSLYKMARKVPNKTLDFSLHPDGPDLSFMNYTALSTRQLKETTSPDLLLCDYMRNKRVHVNVSRDCFNNDDTKDRFVEEFIRGVSDIMIALQRIDFACACVCLKHTLKSLPVSGTCAAVTLTMFIFPHMESLLEFNGD
ncbi:hypothetical protein KEM52_005609 [Ascosphaera acerosa]|nr:hypothetical protein KEM52_005609 [Ascosphaera acerosa]